jgi:hypothetical protein
MAEAMAVVGTVASIIQLIDFVIKSTDRVKHLLNKADELPHPFRDIRLQLRLFVECLRRTRFHLDHGHYEPFTAKILDDCIKECSTQMISLEELVEKVTIIEGDSRATRSRKGPMQPDA